MSNAFRRTGDLKSIGSYPVWLQRVVHETAPYSTRLLVSASVMAVSKLATAIWNNS